MPTDYTNIRWKLEDLSLTNDKIPKHVRDICYEAAKAMHRLEIELMACKSKVLELRNRRPHDQAV